MTNPAKPLGVSNQQNPKAPAPFDNNANKNQPGAKPKTDEDSEDDADIKKKEADKSGKKPDQDAKTRA